MKPNSPRLSGMRLNDPEAFARLILVVLANCKTRRKLAAHLGVSPSTAIRWVKEAETHGAA